MGRKMTTIRPATEADDAIIKRMVRAERLDPTSLKWEHFLVAEEDGQIVGIGQIREHKGCQELGSLVVLPAYRGRGIGAQLISELEKRAGRPLYLLCRHAMSSYYAQFGYQPVPYHDMPPALQKKFLMSLGLRIFNIRVVVMRID
jgi:amino-acid N-acetyltransferase